MSGGGFDDEDGDAVIEMDLLPPRWMDVSDEVTELLAEVAKKSAKLDKLHAKHVLPGFDDEDVRREEEGEIERLTQDITRGFHACQRSIQKVESMVRESKQQGSGVSHAEETMARNIQVSLATRVQEVSTGFRKKQSAYLKSTASSLVFKRQGPSTNEYECCRAPWDQRHDLPTGSVLDSTDYFCRPFSGRDGR